MNKLIKTPFSYSLEKGLSVHLHECTLPQKLHLQFKESGDKVGCTFCLKGTMTTCTNGECKALKITEGTSGIWYAPGTTVNACVNPGEIKWLDIVIEYGRFLELIKDNTKNFCPELLASLSKSSGVPFHRTGLMDSATLQMISLIQDCPFQGSLKKLHLENTCTTLLLGELTRHAILPSLEKCHCCPSCPKMEETKNFLLKDLSNPPTIPSLAAHVGMSESSLKRAFRKAFGMSIYAYFQAYRLEQAKKLLSNGDMNVTEVAFSVGYSNHSHFSRAFKRQFGISPKSILGHAGFTQNQPSALAEIGTNLT